MAADQTKPVVVVGLIRVRQHCTFRWEEPEGGGRRTVEVRATHCPECVDELRELGYLLAYEEWGDR